MLLLPSLFFCFHNDYHTWVLCYPHGKVIVNFVSQAHQLFQFLRTSVPLVFSCCIRRTFTPHALYYLLYIIPLAPFVFETTPKTTIHLESSWSAQSSKQL